MALESIVQWIVIPLAAALVGSWTGAVFASKAARLQRATDRRLRWSEELLEHLGREWAAVVDVSLLTSVDVPAVVRKINTTMVMLRDHRLRAGYSLADYAVQRACWSASGDLFRARSSLERSLGSEEFGRPQDVLTELAERLARRRDELARAIRHELHAAFYPSIWALNVYGRSRFLTVVGSMVARLRDRMRDRSYDLELRRQLRRIRSGLPVE
jgi:hypothetical protein